jgi:hypothetical protein
MRVAGRGLHRSQRLTPAAQALFLHLAGWGAIAQIVGPEPVRAELGRLGAEPAGRYAPAPRPEPTEGVPSMLLPDGLPSPALRGRTAAGLVELDRLTEVTEADVLRLHGVGPKAVSMLREALAERGLALRS